MKTLLAVRSAVPIFGDVGGRVNAEPALCGDERAPRHDQVGDSGPGYTCVDDVRVPPRFRVCSEIFRYSVQ
jgi:hypothetical protein